VVLEHTLFKRLLSWQVAVYLGVPGQGTENFQDYHHTSLLLRLL